MNNRLHYLLERYVAGNETPGERDELLQLIHTHGYEEEVKAWMDEHRQELSGTYQLPAGNTSRLLTAILCGEEAKAVPAVHRVHFMRRWGWVAAAILLFVVCGLWFMVGRRGAEKPDMVQAPVDIAPGHDGAVLTLADGKSIVLDSLPNGVVAQQNGSEVQLKDGKLNYDATHSPFTIDHSRLAYNTLSTPRGRQFQLTLPDGSKVWLNAASSIRYPTVFKGETREVEITGEVYFEVEKDPKKPFGVTILPSTGEPVPPGREAGGGRVEVLGTHFNINSYADEDAIRTTLLEGSVRLTQNAERITLKPGEQAIAAATHSRLTIDHSPDVDKVMAWKNGLFNFDGADLKTVMQQLARWYDLDIRYEGKVPVRSFRGKVTRDLNLSEVIKMLETVEVKFRIEGRKLIVFN